MKTSQFDAKTYGIGELITQRKLFRVPLHQRSTRWKAKPFGKRIWPGSNYKRFQVHFHPHENEPGTIVLHTLLACGSKQAAPISSSRVVPATLAFLTPKTGLDG